MKSKMFIIAAFFQVLFAASLFSQKYENGARLLKGAEVLSATPLQLDYVLENLADTAKITVNLHEGKTHLVLDDGSGEWREWWYHQGKWKLKTTVETDPTVPSHVKSITTTNIANWNTAFDWGNHTWTDISGKPTFSTVATSGSYNDLTNKPTIPVPEGMEGSIQTKSGNNFKGSMLGINDVYIKSLETSNVGFMNNNAYLQVTPQGQAEHRQTNNHWNFRSSLSDTTLYLRNRISFEQSPDFLLNINSNAIGSMKFISKAKASVKTSQIGISCFTGVNLFSQDTDATSQIDVENSKGISLVNKWPSSNTVNDLTINWQKTNFAWKNSTKSREFSLNDGTMQFKTMQGSNETANFYVNSNCLQYSLANSTFYVGDNVFYIKAKVGGDFFTYSITDKLLRVKDAIMFVTDDLSAHPAPRISLTDDYDIKFSRTSIPAKSITLSEIIQKGQIIKQSTEPTIPNDSFAFWVDGSTFYLILNSSGVQKKLQLQ